MITKQKKNLYLTLFFLTCCKKGPTSKHVTHNILIKLVKNWEIQIKAKPSFCLRVRKQQFITYKRQNHKKKIYISLIIHKKLKRATKLFQQIWNQANMKSVMVTRPIIFPLPAQFHFPKPGVWCLAECQAHRWVLPPQQRHIKSRVTPHHTLHRPLYVTPSSTLVCTSCFPFYASFRIRTPRIPKQICPNKARNRFVDIFAFM